MDPTPKHPDVAAMFSRLLQELGISGNQLAVALGTSQQAISNYTSGRNKPGREMLAAISKQYPAIDALWLITGEGDPFPNGRYNEKRTAQLPPPVPSKLEPTQPGGGENPQPYMAINAEGEIYWRSVASERLKQIESLEKTVERLWEQNDTLLKKPAASSEAADLRDTVDEITTELSGRARERMAPVGFVQRYLSQAS